MFSTGELCVYVCKRHAGAYHVYVCVFVCFLCVRDMQVCTFVRVCVRLVTMAIPLWSRSNRIAARELRTTNIWNPHMYGQQEIITDI